MQLAQFEGNGIHLSLVRKTKGVWYQGLQSVWQLLMRATGKLLPLRNRKSRNSDIKSGFNFLRQTLPVKPEARCRHLQEHSSRIWHPRPTSLLSKMMNADMDAVDAENQVELEEKTRLINQVLELQHTLEDLSARVDAVKEENLKLKSENQVLGQYIENLMSASSVFQTTDTKSKRK